MSAKGVHKNFNELLFSFFFFFSLSFLRTIAICKEFSMLSIEPQIRFWSQPLRIVLVSWSHIRNPQSSFKRPKSLHFGGFKRAPRYIVLPEIAHSAPTIFPSKLLGDTSPYPTVVIVTTAHQNACGML